MNGYQPPPTWIPAAGCLALLAVVSLMCLMPIMLVDMMQLALERLHLSRQGAMLAVLGIFLGGLVNIPVYRMEREEPQPVELMGAYGLWAWTPRLERYRPDTLIAINVGGCLVPSILAARQTLYLLQAGGWPLTALCVVVAVNIAICYQMARPVSGIGIMLPAFVPPLAAVGASWVLLAAPQYALVRAPVAFVAGVAGPLIGADLLHLRDIARVSVGMLSIGGAGTFDGIVLSGFLAALLV